jgi:hypothetical protein
VSDRMDSGEERMIPESEVRRIVREEITSFVAALKKAAELEGQSYWYTSGNDAKSDAVEVITNVCALVELPE